MDYGTSVTTGAVTTANYIRSRRFWSSSLAREAGQSVASRNFAFCIGCNGGMVICATMYIDL